MLGQPVFLTAQVGSNAQSEALLALEHVAAVTGVHRDDGVLLGELDDVALLGVQVCLAVETLDEVSRVTQLVQDGLAHTGHDGHVQDNIDGIGQLDAVLGERRAHRTHAVGNHVHGTALHGAGADAVQHGVHFHGVHPVVGGACVFLLLAADEGAALHTGHIAGVRAVEIAAGQLLLVQLIDLTGGAGLFPQSLQLILGAIDPDDLVRGGELDLLVDPIQHSLVLGQFHDNALLASKFSFSLGHYSLF